MRVPQEPVGLSGTRGHQILAMVFCLCVTVLSLLGVSRLTYEAEFIAIVQTPDNVNSSSATQTLSLWQDPPLSLLLNWRGDTVEGMSEAISDLVFDLNFEDGVEQVVSMFSLTLPGTRTNPLERALEEGGDAPQALQQLRSETLFGETLLSPDLRISLIQVQGGDHLALAARYARCAEGDVLCIKSIGSKTIETTIQRQLRSENAFLPLLSGALCLITLAVWFGSLTRAILLMIPPGIGCLWYFGTMGGLSIPFDPFNAIIPTVVMTLGTADMLHLQRAQDLAGTGASARWRALRAVLPAVSITTFTTAIAFGSLYFEGSVILERLAISGVTGVWVLWLSVVVLGPYCVAPRAGASRLQQVVSGRFAAAVQRAVIRWTQAIRVGMAGLMALGIWIALNTPSDFTFHENIPAGETATAFDQASAAGLVLAPIMVTLTPDDVTLAAEKIAEVYASASLSTSFASDLQTSDGRFVLPYPIPFGASASQVEAEKERITEILSQAGSVAISGYPSNVATTVLTIITNLQFILFACFALHAVVIGLLMRSAGVAVATFIPNTLPIFAIYAFTHLMVGWIDVASAVAMILVSGLVVDDTTHILWGGKPDQPAARFSILRGLDRAFEPVFLTTVVLGIGFSPLLFSSLPGLEKLGGLMILALIVAWIADVLLLPALFRRRYHDQD